MWESRSPPTFLKEPGHTAGFFLVWQAGGKSLRRSDIMHSSFEGKREHMIHERRFVDGGGQAVQGNKV